MTKYLIKKIITKFMEKNFLVPPDVIGFIKSLEDKESFLQIIETLPKNVSSNIISQELLNELSSNLFNKINDSKKNNINNLKISFVKNKDCSSCLDKNYNVEIISSYDKSSVKREMKHFVDYFKVRYNALSRILQGRQELQAVISINRLKNKQMRDKVSIIGLVLDISVTKNNNLILTLEDPTGTIKVVINKSNSKLFAKTNELVLDEVIGISGMLGDNVIFVNEIYFPDIPIGKEYKKSPDEVHAAFISDIHVGSNMFLPNDFEKFISWLNGKTGTEEQRDIAKKVKYLFIIGDLVDGVGIYPDQDKELVIKDIKEQYKKCAEYLEKIRDDVNIIVCGGNHDAVRLAEPQPKLDPKYAKPIYDLMSTKNLKIVSNPAMINIHKKENFPGFDVLIYHGYSFDYYVSNVDYIRNNGGYNKAEVIMEFLLRKRHLAPSHSSTLYIPDSEKDFLVIDKVPDFFVTGHIHKASISRYHNVTTICSSCWQAKTNFQEKVGHNPEPSIVPVVNLHTREVKKMRFGK